MVKLFLFIQETCPLVINPDNVFVFPAAGPMKLLDALAN